MNKLETIYTQIERIRTALGMDCSSIEEVADAVEAMANDTSRSGLTTVFVFSNSGYNKPTASTMNMRTGEVEDLDEEGSQEINSPATYNMRAESEPNLFMSKAIFNASGTRISDGTLPTNLKGAKGEPGSEGKAGEKGDKGEPGEKGLDGIVYRTAMAYTATETTDPPLKPRNGFGNRETNEIVDITTDDDNLGYTNSDQVEKKKFRGISEASFTPDGLISGEGSTPFRITGDNGEDGADGTTIEFIYRLLPNMEIYEDLKVHLSEHPLYSPSDDDRTPSRNDNLTNTNGTDSPTGISEEGPLEVVCSRSKDLTTNKWKNGTNCFIWSKGGEDGTDGDGVEYIYLITPKSNGETEITADYVKQGYLPLDMHSLMEHPRYQENEFCINDDGSVEGYNLSGFKGTDEPSDVGPEEPVEWVMSRKKTVKDGARVGNGGIFSEPKIWATYSEDGAAYVTSFVFTRSNEEPPLPTGGEFLDPTPDNSDIGHDSIPIGTQRVWMSKRTFCSSKGDATEDAVGSTPQIMSDSPNFQVEYSANPEINHQFLTSLNDYADSQDPEVEGRNAQLENHNYVGGDDDMIIDPIWMATCNYTNGVGSNWVLTRIKGEKGDAGENGSSVAIEGKFNTYTDLLNAGNKYVTTGSVEDFYFESKDNTINKGDGGYVEDEGLLYSYSGGWHDGEIDTEFEKYWFSTPIKGEPGDSAYFYTAYCDVDPTNDPSAILSLTDPKKYIGTCTSPNVLSEEVRRNPETYYGTKGQGEDGGGWEQVFILTTAGSGYDPETYSVPLPTENEQVPGFLPSVGEDTNSYSHSRGQDSPLTVSEEYPYCGVAKRKAHGNSFSDGTGFGSTASLYSRYSYDGISSANVMLTDDLAIIPMEEGIVDPDFKDEVCTYVQVYVGDESVPAENFTVESDSDCVNINRNKITLNTKKVTPEIKNIPLNVRIGNKDTSYPVTGHILMTDTAYELEVPTNSIRRYSNGENAGKLEQDSVKVYVYKWDGSQGLPSDKELFAEITYTNGSVSSLTQESGIKRNDEVATVKLEGLKDVSKITVYVVQSDDKGRDNVNGTRLSWEVISVAADGLDGGKFDVNLYPDWVVIPMEGTIVDPDFVDDDIWKTNVSVTKDGKVIPAAQTTISIPVAYEDCVEVVMDDRGDPTGEIKIISDKISDFVKKIQTRLPITIAYKQDTSIRRVVDGKFTKSENACKITVDKTSLGKEPKNEYIDRGDDGEKGKINIEVLKSDSRDFQNTNKTLFADIETIEGKYRFIYNYKNQTSSGSGPDDQKPTIVVNSIGNYTFEAYKVLKVKSITFFLTDSDLEDGFVVISETIPVYDQPVSIKSIEKKYYANNNPSDYEIDIDSDSGQPNMPTLTNEKKYMWCKEIITYTNETKDEPPHIYICAVKGEQGAGGVTGNTGKPGPVLYAAGVGDKTKIYEIAKEQQEIDGKKVDIETKVPYVYVITKADGQTTAPAEERYWKLKSASSTPNVHPASGDSGWEKMPYFESIYADAGAFNQALVGSFVFHGDYMYSQYFNKTNGSNIYSSYPSGKEKDTNQPNAGINAKTGDASFAAGAAKFNSNGTWRLGGSTSFLEMDKNGVVSLTGITLKGSDIDDEKAITDSINNANSSAQAAQKAAKLAQQTANNNKWTTEIGESGLETTDVIAKYLKVDAVNITGTLSAGVIKTSRLIYGDTEIGDSTNAIDRILVTSAVPSNYTPNTLYLVVS